MTNYFQSLLICPTIDIKAYHSDSHPDMRWWWLEMKSCSPGSPHRDPQKQLAVPGISCLSMSDCALVSSG